MDPFENGAENSLDEGTDHRLFEIVLLCLLHGEARTLLFDDAVALL